MSDSEENLILDGVYYPESVNIGEAEADKLTYSAHRLNSNYLMPAEPALMLFVGPRGCSKTTKMLALIDVLDWNTLSIFSTSLQQPKFQALMQEFADKEEELQMDLSELITFSNDLSCIIDGTFIKSRNPLEHHLVIIDDFVVSDSIKEKAFLQLALNGRPVGITALISTQTFTGLDKKIRDNATHIALFKGMPPQDVQRIARNYVDGMTSSQFKLLYSALDATSMMGKKIRASLGNDSIGDRPFIFYDKMTNMPEFFAFRINFDVCLNRKNINNVADE